MRFSVLPLCVIGLFWFQQDAVAQRREGTASKFVYVNCSVGFGSPGAAKASLACLFKKRHEVSIGFTYHGRDAKNVPDDYSSFSLFGDAPYPQETVQGLALTYGYVFYPKTDADRLRYVLRGGLLVGQHSTPHSFYPANSSFLGPNYAYLSRNRTTVALVLHPTIDFTPGRVFGLSAGLYAIVAKDYMGGGASIGFLLGRVGNRMRQRRVKGAK